MTSATTQADTQPERRSRLVWAGSAALVALLAFLAYRPFLDLALLGLDTFPMVLSARILTLADFQGTFTEELMDGMYPDGHFYRPVANLSLALDYALWRLTPRGYHLTDLAILTANATLLSALVRKLFGKGALVGAFCAGLLFALHPIQLELQPVPSRRADTLCCTFLLACLLVQPPAGSRARGRSALGALFALLSAASKESGAIAVPLVFAFHLLGARAGTWRERLLFALRQSVLPLLALGLYVATRSAVLGGLGGHSGSSLGALADAPGLIGPYVERILYPQPIFGASQDLGNAFVWTLAIALALAGFAIWRWPGSSVVAARRDLRSGFLFLGAWTVCVLAISSLAGRVHDWYAMLFIAPYAAFLGMLLDRGVALVRSGRPLPALLPLAAAACALTNHIAYSSLVHPYPMWPEASRRADEQIARYERLLEQGSEGQQVVFGRFVPWLPPPEGRPGIRSAFLHAEHSLDAYTKLVHGSRRVHLDFYTGGPLPAPPAKDVLHVILYPGPTSDLR